MNIFDSVVNLKKEYIEIILLYFLAFINFVTMSSLSYLMGPLMFVLILLIWKNNFLIYVIPLVLVGNDALGTVVAGRLSFGLILASLIILENLIKRQFAIEIKSFCMMLVVSIYCFFMQTNGMISSDQTLSTIFYLIIVLYIYNTIIYDKNKFNIFFKMMGVSCFLVALTQLLGVGAQMEGIYRYGSEIMHSVRVGVIGTGLGDPNFAGLRLLLGLICIIYASEIGFYFKIFMSVIVVLALIRTVSITAITVSIILFVFSILLKNDSRRNIKFYLKVGGSILIVLFVIKFLSDYYLSDFIEVFRLRILSKMSMAERSDLDGVTTERSFLVQEGLRYFQDGSILNHLFGFNFHFAHNTYVDMLNQTGILGTLFLVYRIFRGLVLSVCHKTEFDYEEIVVMIKVLYVSYLNTLSISCGIELALTSLFLFLL